MSNRQLLRSLVTEGTKLGFLVAIVFLLQNQMIQVAKEANREPGELAKAHADLRHSLSGTEQRLKELVSEPILELGRSVHQMHEVLAELRVERGEAESSVATRVFSLEKSVFHRLEQEEERNEAIRREVADTSRRVDEFSSGLERNPRRMKRLMIDPTAQLRGNGTVGSGVIVYSERQPGNSLKSSPFTTFVLTAYHVVLEVTGEDLESGLVRDVRITSDSRKASQRFQAQLVLSDRDIDLALLRLNTERQFRTLVSFMPQTELSRLDVFARAYAVGCPLGNQPLPTLGEITSLNKKVGEQTFWMLNAPTFFGNSGGGVYSAENCQLIGISSMIYTYGKKTPTVVPHLGLFVPLNTISDWLEEEGFAFVYQRQPIPRRLGWKLVYRDKPEAGDKARLEKPNREEE